MDKHTEINIENNELTSELAKELQEIKHSYECYQIASEYSSEIIMDYHIMDGSIHHTTSLVEELYHVPQNLEHAATYLLDHGIVLPESRETLLQMFEELHQGKPKVSCTIRTRVATGELRWNRLNFTTVYDDQGVPVRAVGVLTDITSQRVAELQYESELNYRSAMEKDALFSYQADLTNQKVLSGLEAVMGRQPSEQMDYLEAMRLVTEKMVFPDDWKVVYEALDPKRLMKLYHQGVTKTEMEYRRNMPGGKSGWVRGTAYLTEDFQCNCIKIYYYIHDIDAAKLEMLQLREKAERDLLTGLYNKVTTEQMIRTRLQEAKEDSSLVAFYIVDMDNFKNINDQLGHAYGDAVLSEVAQSFSTICRKEDIIGRIGGDEFVFCLKDLPSMNAVKQKAELICRIFHRPRSGRQLPVKISGTVGVSVFPVHGSRFEELYQKADVALYAAKKGGKDQYCIYSPELEGMDTSGIKRADIDKSAEKIFSDNIMEYVFRILYESPNLDMAINGILELLTKHYGFSRGYLFEYNSKDDCCEIIAEWYQENIEAVPLERRVLSGENLKIYRQRFGVDGVYLMKTPQEMRPEDRAVKGLISLRYRFQYSMSSRGDFHGFMGFDQLDDSIPLVGDRIAVLKGVAQMLDIFLSQRHDGQRLEETSRMLQAISDSMQTCTYIIDPETHLLQFVNQSTAAAIPLAVPGAVCYETIRGESEPCADCPIDYMVSQKLSSHHVQMYLPPYHMWATIDTSMVTLAEGKTFALFNGHDFTQYKNKQDEFIVDVEAFTKDAPLYRALSASTDDYIYMCDMPKNLFYFPRAMVEDFNLPGQIIEDAIPLWATYIHPNEQPGFFKDIENLTNGTSSYHNQEYRARNCDGEWVWLQCRGYVVRDDLGNPTLFAGLITNLQKKGKIDHISGLLNKFEFERRVCTSILDTPKKNAQILLLGLDDFKSINSLYGWEFGDWVIRDSAKQMQSLLPPQIPVYRMDGDKFAIYLTGEEGMCAEEIYHVLHSAFAQQQEYKGNRYHCTLSAGALYVDDSDFKTLLKEAEYALEYSKSTGKNRLSFYNPEIMSGKDRIFAIIERLRESVESGFLDFEVYYQPQIDATTRKLVGAEALLRWNTQEFGNVPPSEFIPLLERTGLIHSVGQWVLLEASRACNQWKQVLPHFVISVNVSYLQIREENFVQRLTELAMSGVIDTHSIYLELTESCIVSQDTGITETFGHLRALGFKIALDDFGTGYSSLAILKNAPADIVKLDRCFVRDILKSNFDATFIQTTVTLCHSVGIEVCLEGVEQWEEYNLVNPMGLDYIQGYLFGRPVPKVIFEKDYLEKEHLPL